MRWLVTAGFCAAAGVAAEPARITATALPACMSVERIASGLGPVRGELSLDGSVTGQVLVRLRSADGVSSRTLAVSPAECAEVERTVRLLVEAWSRPLSSLSPAGERAGVTGRRELAPAGAGDGSPVRPEEQPSHARVDDTSSKTNDTSSTRPAALSPRDDSLAAPQGSRARMDDTSSKKQSGLSQLDDSSSAPQRARARMDDTSSKKQSGLSQLDDSSSAPQESRARLDDTSSTTQPSLSQRDDASAAPDAPARTTQPPSTGGLAAGTIASAPAPATAPTRWSLSLSARGHGLYDGALLGAGSLSIDAGLARGLGLTVDAGLETARTVTLTTGSATTWLSYGTLLARFTLPAGDWGFTFSLGARIFRTAAKATGFTTTDPEQVRYAPAAVAAVEVHRTLWRGLFASANLTGFARQPQNLTIRGVSEPIAQLGPLGIALAIGAGWNFF